MSWSTSSTPSSTSGTGITPFSQVPLTPAHIWDEHEQKIALLIKNKQTESTQELENIKLLFSVMTTVVKSNYEQRDIDTAFKHFTFLITVVNYLLFIDKKNKSWLTQPDLLNCIKTFEYVFRTKELSYESYARNPDLTWEDHKTMLCRFLNIKRDLSQGVRVLAKDEVDVNRYFSTVFSSMCDKIKENFRFGNKEITHHRLNLISLFYDSICLLDERLAKEVQSRFYEIEKIILDAEITNVTSPLFNPFPPISSTFTQMPYPRPPFFPNNHDSIFSLLHSLPPPTEPPPTIPSSVSQETLADISHESTSSSPEESLSKRVQTRSITRTLAALQKDVVLTTGPLTRQRKKNLEALQTTLQLAARSSIMNTTSEIPVSNSADSNSSEDTDEPSLKEPSVIKPPEVQTFNIPLPFEPPASWIPKPLAPSSHPSSSTNTHSSSALPAQFTSYSIRVSNKKSGESNARLFRIKQTSFINQGSSNTQSNRKRKAPPSDSLEESSLDNRSMLPPYIPPKAKPSSSNVVPLDDITSYTASNIQKEPSVIKPPEVQTFNIPLPFETPASWTPKPLAPSFHPSSSTNTHSSSLEESSLDNRSMLPPSIPPKAKPSSSNVVPLDDITSYTISNIQDAFLSVPQKYTHKFTIYRPNKRRTVEKSEQPTNKPKTPIELFSSDEE